MAAVPHDLRLYNDDLGADDACAAHVGHIQLHRAMVFDVEMEVTTYMLASGLIAGGMNWWEAIGTILLGNLIVLIPMLLNAHAGAKYGIPFPVFVRASFGTERCEYSSDLAGDCAARGWFGIQSWIGGQSIAAMVECAVAVAGCGSPSVIWICFLGFWLL